MEKLLITVLASVASLTIALQVPTNGVQTNSLYCGRPTVQMRTNPTLDNGKRILGGVEARPGSHPWIVSIKRWGEHECAGTLIRMGHADKSDIVITAAHCMYNKRKKHVRSIKHMRVTAGAHDLSSTKEMAGEQSVEIYHVTVHEEFDVTTYWNDIAIIKLAKPIWFNSNVQPLCLPAVIIPVIKSGTEVTVAGWGQTEKEGGAYSNVLMQVGLKISNYDFCEKIQKQKGNVFVKELMVCAGTAEGGRGFFSGDAGGPLLVQRGDTYYMIGVVSFGPDNGLPRVPGVYVRIRHYLDWIQETIDDYYYKTVDVYSRNCGRSSFAMREHTQSNTGQRIVGGIEARPHSHPWAVSLKKWDSHTCGGALIRVADVDETDIMITAAHCVYNSTSKKYFPVHLMTVTAGAHDVRKAFTGQQTVQVHSVHIHESYVSHDEGHDIAIVKLLKPIQFNMIVQPLCLPSITSPRIKPGTEAIAAGWGRLKTNGSLSGVLMQVDLQIWNHGLCAKEHGEDGSWLSKEIALCAGTREGGKDTCQGDSGGPLTVKQDDVYVLHGVVSFGRGCGLPKMPGVYVRVTGYLEWIREQVQQVSDIARKNIDVFMDAMEE